MSNEVSFEYSHMESLPFEEDGHYHIKIPTFFKENNYSNVLDGCTINLSDVFSQ